MRVYSIHTYFGYDIPMAERARIIKEAGFASAMLMWSEEFVPEDADLKDYPEIIRSAGLSIENVHLPFFCANGIWLDNLEGQEAMDIYHKCIEDCTRYNFPVAVIHPNRSQNTPPVNELGLDRFKRLADSAAEAGTVLALENVSVHNYIEPVFEAVDSPGLGFCYDSGHDLLYSPKPYELPRKYADRLVALHLHDNMMEKDEHRIPIEGMINLHALVDSIVDAGYEGPLSLEVACPKPDDTPESYVGRAYAIATVLEKLRNYEY